MVKFIKAVFRILLMFLIIINSIILGIVASKKAVVQEIINTQEFALFAGVCIGALVVLLFVMVLLKTNIINKKGETK